MSWLTGLTPAQEWLVTDLLGKDQPRPAVDRDLAASLRQQLEEGVAPFVRELPEGDQIFLNKTALTAITTCDGRYLDHVETPFSWSRAPIVGRLTHKAVELDWHTEATLASDEVVRRAIDEVREESAGVAAWLDDLDDASARILASQVTQLLIEVRDTWPTLPPRAGVRSEQPLRVRLAGGRVALSGTPDVIIGRARADEARMLLVDFKTGIRRPQSERDELRFYGLLATIKYGVPPWRWAAFYLAECAWDAEDATEELLRVTVRRVVDGVERAVALRTAPAGNAELRLHGGSWCRFCSRRPTCPAAPADVPDS